MRIQVNEQNRIENSVAHDVERIWETKINVAQYNT